MVSRNIAIMSSVTAAVGVVATAALARPSGVPDCNGSVRRVPDLIWVSGLRGGGGAFIRRMVLPIKVAGIVPAVIYFSRLSGGCLAAVWRLRAAGWSAPAMPRLIGRSR